MSHFRFLSLSFLLAIFCLSMSGQEKKKKISVFRDSLDHAYDISDWLINKKGMLVVPTIITDPAVGYGIAGDGGGSGLQYI